MEKGLAGHHPANPLKSRGGGETRTRKGLPPVDFEARTGPLTSRMLPKMVNFLSCTNLRLALFQDKR
jgi:hypothetical protein